jgi:hypothetical protein
LNLTRCNFCKNEIPREGDYYAVVFVPRGELYDETRYSFSGTYLPAQTVRDQSWRQHLCVPCARNAAEELGAELPSMPKKESK